MIRYFVSDADYGDISQSIPGVSNNDTIKTIKNPLIQNERPVLKVLKQKYMPAVEEDGLTYFSNNRTFRSFEYLNSSAN